MRLPLRPPIAAFGASGVYFDSGGGLLPRCWRGSSASSAAVLFIAVTEHAVRVRFVSIGQAEGWGSQR